MRRFIYNENIKHPLGLDHAWYEAPECKLCQSGDAITIVAALRKILNVEEIHSILYTAVELMKELEQKRT